MDAYDKYDHEFCGTEKPYAVVSEGPRLVMVFSSGELQGRGFKVKSQIKSNFISNSMILFIQIKIRENIPLRLNTKSREQQHQMELVALLIAAHRRRKANLTHHVILPTIHPTQTVLLCLWRRLMSKSR